MTLLLARKGWLELEIDGATEDGELELRPTIIIISGVVDRFGETDTAH